MKARLLFDGEREAARHFAMEEALLRSVDSGEAPPTLRIRRSVPALWLGLFQRPEEDIDLGRARELGVPVVRRHNPGGTVYQDEGTLCYSLFFPRDELFRRLGLGDPAELYALFGKAAIRALARFGVEAELSPLNDVTIGGRKVYGSAQLQQYSAFVHSGSFLVSCDLGRMAELLRPSALKYAGRGFTGVRERVVNLAEAADRSVSPELLAEALVPELAAASGYSFVPGDLGAGEARLAETLLERKYGRPEWTFRPAPRFRRSVSGRSRTGVVTLGATLEAGVIAALELRGDFLLPEVGSIDAFAAAARGLSPDQAADLARGSALPGYLAATVAELLGGLA